MSKVDWSLAPEGATHYGEVSSNRICWYSVKSDCRYDYAYQDEGYHAEKWTPSGGAPGHPPLIPRPKPKPWSGPEDGLPPVGTVCEWKYADSQTWKATKILYIGSVYVIVPAHDGEQHYYVQHMQFRAVKTPDQQAAQLRETAIRELMDIAGVDCRVTAARLVDAGFKLPSKSESRDNAVDAMELIVPHIGSVAAGKLYDSGFKREVK